MVIFEEYSSSEKHDLIQVFVNSTQVTLQQEDQQTYERTNSETILPGWVRVQLNILNNATVMYLTSATVPLVSYPVQNSVQEVIISGSNVTINCKTGKLIWHIEGKSVVPLAKTSELHHFGVFSKNPVLPNLTLDGRSFLLGWYDHSISTTSNHPLPPAMEHKLIIDCLEPDMDGVVCKIKNDSKEVLELLTVPSSPAFLVIDSGDQDLFLLQYISILPNIAHVPPAVIAVLPTITTPLPTDTTTTGFPKVPGWSGWWVFVTVLLAILLVFVIIICCISHYHRPKIEKYLEGMHFISEATREDVEIQLQPERRPLLMRSVSLINTDDPKFATPLRLWNAVASGEQEEVEQVLATLGPNPQVTLGGWDTSPYEEAHQRGRSNILHLLEAFMHKQPHVPQNDMILQVLQAHMKKVDAVFEAASGGQYRYTGGVDVLLRAYSLPGTVQDQHGRSLLHYAASVMLADEGPLWLAPDIRSLVEDHGVYVNAVDFNGFTALHSLTEKASTCERNTCWDGKALSVKEAWVNLANLLMSLGCDPRLSNHQNKYPHQVARDSGNAHLANHLAKAVGNLGMISSTESIRRFSDFAEASKTGNVKVMQDLLMKGVKVLPLGSHKDPLLEAIQGGHRDAVFLLLSAGAPLCAHGLVGDTPFEAAHNTNGLPALFPALIRKAFCDRLNAEIEMIPGSDDLQNIMSDGMAYLKTTAETSGHKLEEELGTWLDRWPTSSSVNYTDMLAMASSLGLTLTCQLLGVAGVQLNPLPNHLHPLVMAVNNSHHETAYSLCRDLKMNPYSTACNLDNISEQLANDLLESELQKFERKLRKKEVGDSVTADLLDYAKGVKEGQTDKQNKTFMYLLAELSLVTILHRIRMCSSVDINGIVHDASGSTMLHIAAAYGKINMVEYLLSQGANHACMTFGGLAAVHLAAVRGHKACMEYMVEFTQNDIECSAGMKSGVIFHNFKENVKKHHLDILSCQESSVIANTKGDHAKAKLILTYRCEKLGIKSSTSLWDSMTQELKKTEHLLSKDFESSVKSDAQMLFDKIGQVDKRFVGKIVPSFPLGEKTEFFLPESFEFYLELDSYSALLDGCISIKEMERNEVKNGEYIIGISSEMDQDLFIGATFKNSFCKAVHEALAATSFKYLALVPPFLAHTSTGVCIYTLYHYKQRVLLLRLMLSPVLKAPFPRKLQLHKLPEHFQNHLEANDHEHIGNTSEGNWIYMFNFTFKSIIAGVKEEEYIVLQACFYFARLLSTCWWLPKQEKRRNGRAWQIYPVGVNVPSPRTLKSLFLQELIEEHEQHWDKEHFIERIISVLKRASYSGKCVDSIMPPQWQPALSGGIQATIQFLQNLQEKTADKIKKNIIFNLK